MSVAIRAGRVEAARPLLKWAGGKRQLLPRLREYYPRDFGAYWEPFFGSGAVFFDLHASGRLQGRRAHLLDSNADLIGCYAAVRDAAEAVISELACLDERHRSTPGRTYYDVRNASFNPERARLRQTAPAAYSPRLAAMFIYLNHTGYNGLFRLNARGEFNVPAGRYANPRICDADTIRAVARAFGSPGTTLRAGGFEEVLDEAERGDFLYFDPPYAPLSSTSRFTEYTTPRFGEPEQARLQQVVIALARRGCHVVVSNSTARAIVELYERSPEARAAGLVARRVPARRSINSRASARGTVEEFLITNVHPVTQHVRATD